MLAEKVPLVVEKLHHEFATAPAAANVFANGGVNNADQFAAISCVGPTVGPRTGWFAGMP
ncbi:MAG: hypothetical protein JSR44_10340 [Spirochaetes bacterium]|nr:hypothetical protein [Spirochaetota bacterium]